MAHLGSAARGEWRPLSDSKRKSVDWRRQLVYEFRGECCGANMGASLAMFERSYHHFIAIEAADRLTDRLLRCPQA